MAKIGLNKLNLNKKQDVKVIQYEGNDIEIIQHLDIGSKSALVSAAVRGSVIQGIVDEILLDAYLHLFIVDRYTNISLTQKQRENLLETFDLLESNKFFDVVISGMAENEYDYIFTMAKRLMNNVNEYNRNIISMFQGFEDVIQELLGQAQTRLDK